MTMSEELLINVSPMESRVAVLSNGVLSELYIERHNKMGLVGNIYIGTVVRVLPGMQAAFVDIGQSRTAFLHVNDMKKPKKVEKVQALPLVNASVNTKDNTDTNINTVSNNVVSNTVDAIESKQQIAPLVNTSVINSSSVTNPCPTPLFTSEDAPYTHSIHQDSAGNQINQQANLVKKNTTASFFASHAFPVDSPLIATPNDNIDKKQPIEETTIEPIEPVTPNFRILSTVTEILTKEIAVDSLIEKDPQSFVEDRTNPTANLGHSKKAKRQTQVNPDSLIQNRLREGQKVLVQVTKDQLGTKGARLTTNISLPSRYLVYLPSSESIGISQRIENTEERDRLRAELGSLMQTVNLTGGLIARTAAERISKEKLEEDIYYLLQLWRTIQARKQNINAHLSSILVYQELSLPLRSLRDLVHENTERVVVDDAKVYDYLKQFANEFVPTISDRIVPYHSPQPMFDVYRVEEDLKDALKRRVDLKSGGYLIIDQTEAMTTIDVNTGSYVGGRSLEDTVYKTNLEATHAIARQLRLRNLGGIIILDFIDMQEQEHRDDVLISLQTQLAEDYARTNITQISELGLVEMTRKRTRESLEQQLCEPCTTCQGRGFIKTAETVCFEIFREIMRCARTYNAPKQFTVVAHASVIDLLLTSEADTVADLEYLIGRVITFEVENLYTQEQYDIVLD